MTADHEDNQTPKESINLPAVVPQPEVITQPCTVRFYRGGKLVIAITADDELESAMVAACRIILTQPSLEIGCELHIDRI